MAARKIAIVLIAAMGLLSIVSPANAGFIPSGDSQERSIRDQDLETISKALETKDTPVGERSEPKGMSEPKLLQRVQGGRQPRPPVVPTVPMVYTGLKVRYDSTLEV